MEKLNFIETVNYDGYQEHEAGDYKIVHYNYLSEHGEPARLKSNWRAYKRIDGLKGRPFGNNVDRDCPWYSTRREAERACNKAVKIS